MESLRRHSGWVIVPALCAGAAAAQQTITVVDLERAWFKPSFVVNDAPVCEALLAEVNRRFAGPAPLREFDGTFSVDGLRFVPFQQLPQSDAPNSTPYDRMFVVRGKSVYLRGYTNPGCGGACETYGLVASDRPFPPDRSSRGRPEGAAATPAAENTVIFASQDETYYAGVIAEDVVRLLEVQENGTWRPACGVSIAPAKIDEIDDAELKATLSTIRSLLAATAAVAGSQGEGCGTLATTSRWAAARWVTMIEALYRPLQILYAGRADLSYAALVPNLEAWALTGIAENDAFATYQSQLAATTEQLATFYTTHYRWTLEQARPVAREALQGAVAAGMHFSEYYQPFDGNAERQLRSAIFSGEPIEAIRSIPIDAATIDGIEFTGFEGRETLLSSAVRHPAALQYLLERGGDPDRRNAFGKTPLMYAAQYNELEAARILLDHGADPNAATTRPYDRCTYPLSRANVTALHYAVRYAAPELIELLVERGAVTHVKTESLDYREEEEYPLDWLRRYADPSSTEPNPYVFAEALPALERLLHVPSDAERAALAPRLVLEAEAAYAAGDAETAYRTLKSALQIDPGDARALSDMSLIGLRAGQLGEALEAANKLIAANSEPRLLASAWFNQGLACEQSGRGTPGVLYNGTYYCQTSLVAPFVEAWKIEPTAGRASKLDELFHGGTLRVCVRTQPDGAEQRLHFAIEYVPRSTTGWRERIYAYHPTGTTIDRSAIGATALVGEHVLGASTVTVLDGQVPFRRLEDLYARCGA